jgi:two-component system sensor histidine kinase UhpB
MIDTARNSPEIHDMCIEKSYEGINLAIEEVRKLSHTLVPPAFTDDNKFIDAVNNLVANFEMSGKTEIKVDIPANGQFKLSDEKIKLTFYRIIQEQLNNILKYARATTVSITLLVAANKYQLIISDNGAGFDINEKHKGIGLRNIESRVEVHSGTVEIISAPGEGCTLKIEIPFKI